MKKILCATLVSGLIFTGCSKSSTTTTPTGSNTSKQTTLDYQLKTSNANTGIGLNKTTATPVIKWTSGFANPTQIKFEASQSGTQIEYKSTNTTQIDLMSASALSFGSFTIPTGTYNEIELKIELNKNGSNPALQLKGELTVNAVTIPVVFVANENVELKTEQHGVTVTDSTLFTAITTIDLSVFTSGISATTLASGQLSNGTIVISADVNKDLYKSILKNIGDKSHGCEFEHHH